MKVKTIPLKISKVFPRYHPRKGELTNFRQKIMLGEKIHTIRGNYDYWRQAIDKIKSGEAILVLEQWIDRPYWSKVEDFMVFDNNKEIGVQKLEFIGNDLYGLSIDNTCLDLSNVATNDGLKISDFVNWFEKGKYNLLKPMAIIHFTGFRY